jgi:hypothetical protein
VAGLYDTNAGTYLVTARLKNPEIVEVRKALQVPTSMHPTGVWPGGLPEYYFIRPAVPSVDLDYLTDEPLVPHY